METFIINSEEQWFTLPKEKEAKFRKIIGDRKKGRIYNIAFFINDNDEIKLIGKFIKQDVKAFYHADYNSGSHWKEQGSILRI
ncbi:hypothetical protein [Riemerella columbipharyngis]|uniref:Uncharacterized protein n=1 Tax=Riemerella columbipharyngis TaxID=1071918 RepID=A0A1G7FFU5_9FLAO|nr:hypothetical protein [Riemerella columbipharyngis]SDE74766.1 hypothetical protein SAMN05421544_12229 [Riemerella columbipharyngis]